MKLVLNDKSFFKECDKSIAKIILEVFLHTYHDVIKLAKGKIDRAVLSSQKIETIMVNDSYGFPVWRNDRSVDLELIRLFRSLCERQELNVVTNDTCEVSFGAIKDGSLLTAVLKEYPLLSFKTDEKWENTNIDVTITYIDKPSEIITIHNFYNELKQDDIDWINALPNEEHLEKYPTPLDLKNNLTVALPNLLFHDTAIKQLASEVQNSWYRLLFNKLIILNDYFNKANTDHFEKDKFPPRMIGEESDATIARFRSKYTFIYNEEPYLIRFHARYTGNSMGRIYFVPLMEQKKGLIYSLTTKLPTVSDPKLDI